ncbi:MAG: GGDEF domain-containing protein [Hyphomicrobiaceae bacterium]|nr:GGDEF domain-containing protein [Hyphomicrobiaceae bacterium]
MSKVTDHGTAKRLFLKAVELMAEAKALLVPRYFQLFYEYVEGSNRALANAFAELLKRNPQPAPSELDFLFELHLSDTSAVNEYGGMGDKLGEEVHRALGIVQEAVSSARSFGDSVECAETDLADYTDEKKVRAAIVSLLRATRQMAQKSRSMESKLTASVEQIEQLQKTLNKIKLEAQTDSLTGVANRKLFDETLAGEISIAEETGAPLSLCMVDVDHFKAFNDRHGHRAGDSALRFVANVFHHSVRDGDLVARYGGEEFAVIMPGADIQVGVTVADRIRETLAGRELVNRTSGETLGFVTVSIGVAELQPGELLESLIDRADEQLYAAKDAGRNRVMPEPEDGDTGQIEDSQPLAENTAA